MSAVKRVLIVGAGMSGMTAGKQLVIFVALTRAREAGRRDAARPARAAQRLLAARW